MSIWRWTLLALLALLMVGGALYLRDMGRAYERISGRSSILDYPGGSIEFTAGGKGPAVLVVHGSGGGYDQGELIAQAMLGDGFRWIAPSRLGYLRSTLREGATFDDQAHAYAHLLDHLGVRQVAVVALSHGGPSALLFALLYPQRVSSLTLVSCGVASTADPGQAQANRKGDALTTVFRYDPLYWVFSTVLKRALVNLMGASAEVMAGLSPQGRLLVDQLIQRMNPVAPRSAGVVFDNTAVMPNERIAGIRAPTLIFHATDDTLQRHHNAVFAAATIPGAQLHSFDAGGHLLLAVEQTTIRSATQAFIRDHAGR